jgi:hypothetical protein
MPGMSLRFLAVLPAAAFLCACDPEPALSPSDPLESERLSGGATQPNGAGGAVTGTGIGGAASSTGSDQGGSSPSAGGSGPGNGGGGSGQGGESSSISVGVGGAGACEGGVASIAGGAEDRILLRGTIVAESGIIEGEILIDGNEIACIAASCAADPGADGATIVETGGYIYPGLIDAHNHILFDIFDEDDWSPTEPYTNHDQWADNAEYEVVVDAKQDMNGEMGSDIELGCEMDKYGEMKALIAGTTSVQGSPGTSRNCYGSLTRTIDGQNDLPDDLMQTATIFPSRDAADAVCANFADGDTTAYLIHVGEGVDQTALDEWEDLEVISTVDGCLVSDETAIIHGTAFGMPEFQTMAEEGMSLIWSPKSNVFLYGAGTDTSQTTDIPTVLGLGINVGLGPDWSLGGSVNMLDELRFADAVDDAEWDDILTPQMLFEMATINNARAMKLEAYIGSLAVGKRADLFVLTEITSDPYDTVFQALPRDVVLTMVDGKVLYGDASLVSLAPSSNECEVLDICCASKFACIAESGGSPADRLDQTFAEITAALEAGLTEVAPQFMPLAPIVRCP